LNNNGFFAIEQISASAAMLIAGVLLFYASGWTSGASRTLSKFHTAFINPHPIWPWATISGLAYGMVAFFSVFIFMFKGRTATFAGLVNRLTSLVAGTTATLLSFFIFGGKFP